MPAYEEPPVLPGGSFFLSEDQIVVYRASLAVDSGQLTVDSCGIFFENDFK